MAETPETPQVPDAGDRPRIGVDEWVAEAEGRDERYRGRLGELRRRYDQIPVPGRFAAFLIVAATIPFMTSSDYIVRVGINTLLFALLALGLNVVVGYAGLLDLGYIAFYGFGAYMYGILSSNQFTSTGRRRRLFRSSSWGPRSSASCSGSPRGACSGTTSRS